MSNDYTEYASSAGRRPIVNIDRGNRTISIRGILPDNRTNLVHRPEGPTPENESKILDILDIVKKGLEEMILK